MTSVLAPQRAIRWLQLSVHKVDSLGLFSPNEQAEDIATADLKYLLVPYLLAEAMSRDSTQDKALHLQRLQMAASSLRTSVCLPSSVGVHDVPCNMKVELERCVTGLRMHCHSVTGTP